MRLIDADELKYKNIAEVNGILTHVLTAEEIDNAPTVRKMRLIDADELKKDIDKERLTPPNKIHMWKIIDNAPTVETTIEHFVDLNKIKTDCLNCEKFERPQGEWKPHNNSKYDFECSLCNFPAPSRLDGWSYKTKFCPWCGAIMTNSEV